MLDYFSHLKRFLIDILKNVILKQYSTGLLLELVLNT